MLESPKTSRKIAGSNPRKIGKTPKREISGSCELILEFGDGWKELSFSEIASIRIMPISPISEYIVYLEPATNSSLSIKLDQYYRKAADISRQNEALMYHPHISTTGFFHMQETLCDLLISTISRALEQAQKIKVMLKPLISINNPSNDSVSMSVRIEIEVQGIEDVLKHVQNAMPNLRLRIKQMDHISLGYIKSFTDFKETDFEPWKLFDLACACFQDMDFSEAISWTLSLYRREIKSHDIETPHMMKAISKWVI